LLRHERGSEITNELSNALRPRSKLWKTEIRPDLDIDFAIRRERGVYREVATNTSRKGRAHIAIGSMKLGSLCIKGPAGRCRAL